MKHFIYLSFLILILLSTVSAQTTASNDPLRAEDFEAQQQWVDLTYQSMTLDERIGQLIFVFTDSKGVDGERQRIEALIKKQAIGGLLFSVGDPLTQLQLTNHYQSLSDTKLLVTMDAEWGLSMRLKNSYAFPYNMTLGAVQDDQLIYRVGERLAEHAKRIGVHMNYAPVADVNTDPRNPIIGNRSFGSRPERVSELW